MELHAVRIFVLPAHQVNCESDMNQKIDNIYKKIEAIKDDLLKFLAIPYSDNSLDTIEVID